MAPSIQSRKISLFKTHHNILFLWISPVFTTSSKSWMFLSHISESSVGIAIISQELFCIWRLFQNYFQGPKIRWCAYSHLVLPNLNLRIWGRKRVLLIKVDQKYRDKMNSDCQRFHCNPKQVTSRSGISFLSSQRQYCNNLHLLLNGKKLQKLVYDLMSPSSFLY